MLPLLILGAAVLGAAFSYFHHRDKLAALRQRLAPITSAEAEAAKLRKKAEADAASVRAKAERTAREVLDAANAEAERARGIVADAQRRLEAITKEAQRARDAAATELAERVEKAVARERAAIAEVEADLRRLRSERDQTEALAASQRQLLLSEYEKARLTYERLKAEISVLEEHAEDLSFGVYKPAFRYDTSEAYKRALEALWQEEKRMVREGDAAHCRARWEVSGDKRAGERMTKQYVKLLVRAFNGECDAAIAKVSWNNAGVMEQRIRKAFEALNELGGVMQMELRPAFLDLKLRELQLTFEMEERKQREKEEARRIREQMREEERVEREIAQAAEKAEKDERNTAKALEKARREAEEAADEEERRVMAERIAALEAALAEAQAQRERALAQAQLTKSGHIYVLSNLGAFGEGMVKIGMTRRLEPMERVQELGDASVPFPFDVHALVYTENAPQLEMDLHNHFWEHRVNLANDRKEFFRVSITAIEAYLRERGLQVEMVHAVEAKEYRQTLASIEQGRAAQAQASVEEPPAFPEGLFANQRP
jgi:hypothetical protein